MVRVHQFFCPLKEQLWRCSLQQFSANLNYQLTSQKESIRYKPGAREIRCKKREVGQKKSWDGPLFKVGPSLITQYYLMYLPLKHIKKKSFI